MEAKAIKKPPQKNTKNHAQNEPELVPKGGPELEAKSSKMKSSSQVESRAPPGSILERFWDHFGTIFVSFSDIVLVIFGCIL